VLIAPADMVSYNKDPSKMSVARRKGMRNTLKLFLLKWWGSEANYMIGEMVTPEDTGSGATYINCFELYHVSY
jgi:hypothetical protein